MSHRSSTATVVALSFIGFLLVEPIRLAAQPAPGLVAAYSFNEGTGSTLSDLSGNNIAGTIIGATWTAAGKYGNALSFNGSSNYVDLGNPTALRLTGSMTWSAWVKAAANPADDGQIIAKSNDASGWQLKSSPDTGPHTFGVAVTASGNVHVQRYSTTVRQLNTWYYVAGVYNATARTLDIYVNGVLDNGVLRGTVPASQINSTVNVNIGRRTTGYYFNGVIDEVRVYNRALSQTEVQTDMNTPLGVVTPDTQPPSAPGTLTATAISGTQINLSWGAATDNVGVTGYRVERCQGAGCSTFAQIATPTATTYSDTTGLAAGINYSYRVLAVDAATNLGPYSNTASAITPAPDTQPPSAPGTLTATAISGTQINLAWGAATDNVAVAGYRVERCQGAGCSTFAQIATPTATTYNDTTGLTSGVSYSYRVLAIDAATNLGPYSNTATAVTPAPDTQAPSAPGTLTATAISGTQINLSWGAATDNVAVTGYRVERCQGAGCSTFAQIATPTATTYNDTTGLTSGVSYSYRVLAVDAATNLGPYSNTASATTPDTQVPSAPGTLTATAISGTQINLSWGAATDNVAVTGYLVERCQGAGCSNFAQIATPTATTYSDSNLTSGISYSYRTRATDAAANLGPYSNTASAATLDTQAPSAPTGLGANATSNSQISLGWTASTDNVAVTGYLIERCQGAGCSTFAQVATSAGTTYSDSSLSTATSYSYRIRATDAANNLSLYSSAASATTTAAGSNPPVLSAETHSATDGVGAAFSKSTLSINVSGPNTLLIVAWHAEFDGGLPNNWTVTCAGVPGTAFVDTDGYTGGAGNRRFRIYYWLNPAPGANTIVVSNPYNGGNELAVSAIVLNNVSQTSPLGTTALDVSTSNRTGESETVNTATSDLVVHVIADALLTTGALGSGETSISLANDGHHPADGDASLWLSTKPGGSPSTTVSSSGWASRVINGAAIVVHGSAAAGPDTQAPSAPTNLTAGTVTSNQITLTWGASTDNVAVTGYRLERCQGAGCGNFAQIAAPAPNSYSDSSVTAGNSYSYRVLAADAASNLSPYSNVYTTVTPVPDTVPPSATGTLTATAISGTQINLSWGAATDNVAVTGYRLERCQNAGCTDFARIGNPTGTTYSDSGLLPSTTYSYQVRAQDAAVNLGPYSNIVTIATLANIPGLVSSYSFGEGSGLGVADSSGNGNSGTINGAAWTPNGKYGSALTFNGNTSYVDLGNPASLQLSTSMTLSAWINAAANPSNDGQIIAKSNGSSGWQLKTTPDTGPHTFGIAITNNSGAAVQRYSTTVRALNTWYHVAGVYNAAAQTLSIYVNGVLDNGVLVGTVPTSQLASSVNVNIGRRTGGYFFNGAIDEVRVYNRALTQAEIQSDMGAPIGSGTLPSIGLSTTNVQFGNQGLGTFNIPQNVTLTNTGAATLALGGVSITGFNPLDFSRTSNCNGASLAPNASCTVGVTFTPTAVGTRSATLTIADNAPGNPHTVSLTGTGVATGLSISPRVTVLTTTRTQQFTAGSGGVNWLVDGVAGGAPASGTVSNTGLYTPPGTAGTHTVTVTTADQSQSATATVYISTHPGVFTYHNDNTRTGQNANEAVLTPSNVNPAQFGKLLSYSLDGQAYASPLYVANVNIPGQGFHNVVYIATEHDSVYAFDADGLSANPLWKVSFLGTGITSVPAGDTGECCDIAPEIGITGTPVIDPVSGTLYVVALTKEGASNYVQRLHALDITTGVEKFGGPVLIQASVPGSGSGTQSGQVPFNALRQNQRPALLLANGVVYIASASHGDVQPWHGWVLGYNASNLQRVMAFNVSPNGYGGGIWMSGGGVATDSTGNLFFTTGNGNFNANTGGTDYGDSVMKITPGGSVVDYFTPYDQNVMESINADLASAGPVLLLDQPGPIPHLLITAGKGGSAYVLNRDNMGHYNSSSDSQIVQSLVNIFPHGTPEPGNYIAPVYFNGAVYFSPVNDTIHAFKLSAGLLPTSPSSVSSIIYAYPGGAISVSANGTSNGVLWAIQRPTGGTGSGGTDPGILRAYDPSNLGIELYNSSQAGTRDTMDIAVKFNVPLVVNGKVFVASNSKLTVYGLLP